MSIAGEFVEDWNGRKLSAKYYAGLTGSSNLRRTKHQWGIRPGQGGSPYACGCCCNEKSLVSFVGKICCTFVWMLEGACPCDSESLFL